MIGTEGGPKDANCIFCKIVAGEIPCFKIYEDDLIVSFLDIGPVVKGHTLVIPKGHYAHVMEVPPEVLARVSSRLPMLVRSVLSVVGASACHVLLNNGREAMQSVPHLHYHIIPRVAGDGFHVPWPAKGLDKSDAQRLVEAIKEAIGRSG